MGNLIDPRHVSEESKKGFTPNVQNDQINFKVSKAAKFMWFVLMWFPIGMICLFLTNIYRVTRNNKFKRAQLALNTATSNIEVQLIKRRDTLVKLVDATKSSVRFEKKLLTDVTALRNINAAIPSNKIAAVEAQTSGVFGRVMATMENYPQLESTQTIRNLMETADYIEREIAANRRVYNEMAGDYNKDLYIFPACIIANKHGYTNMPLIAASEIQKQDVSMDLGNGDDDLGTSNVVNIVNTTKKAPTKRLPGSTKKAK